MEVGVESSRETSGYLKSLINSENIQALQYLFSNLMHVHIGIVPCFGDQAHSVGLKEED